MAGCPKQNVDGTFTLTTPGAVMFALCATTLGAPPDRATLAERAKFHRVLEELMDAACAGGFEHSDELDAWTLAGRITERSVALALEAERCAGRDQVMRIVTRNGI